MRAKSEILAERRKKTASAGKPAARRVSLAGARLPHAERRAQIIEKAGEFFAEYGLTAQTRALAEACGISQRLLYRFFPSKAAILEEVYKSVIAGSFKAAWFAQLGDRTRPVAARLRGFYADYYESVLNRRWLRLFLYASLAEVNMAPMYIAEIVNRLLDLVIAEAAHELGRDLPGDAAEVRELGWMLHGAVSHLAIRRHIYHNDNPVPVETVLDAQIGMFLQGLAAILPAREDAGRGAERGIQPSEVVA